MIRIIALSSMLLDHIFQIYFPNIERFNIIGRLAFPLFAWGIAKGFKLTRNYKLYALRLLILAIISQVPYFLLFKYDYLNVCFTLLAGLLLLKVYESKIPKLAKWLIIIFSSLLVDIMNFEYGIYGIATIMIFHIFYSKKSLIFCQLAVAILGINFYGYSTIQVFSLLAIPIIIYLEKYDFKINKLVEYGFYPLHILLLWVLTFIIPVVPHQLNKKLLIKSGIVKH